MVTSVTEQLSALPNSLVWAIGCLLLLASLLITSMYTFSLLRWVAHRRWRVAAFLPVMIALTLLPNTLFSRDTHILGVGAAACVASWWAAHKSLSYLLNYRRAPESGSGFRALLTFCAVIILPVRIARKNHKGQGFTAPALRAAWYIFLLAIVGARLLPAVAAVAWPLQAFFRGLIIFGTSAFVSDLCAAAAEAVGVHTERAFLAPWLASSLGEFWTKRWNLPASDVLRDSVYYPTIDLLMMYKGSGKEGKLQRICSANDRRKALFEAPTAIRVVASLVTFFVSGVMHELVILCLTGEITGEMTLFFTLHGVMLVVESAMATTIKRTTGVPFWLKIPIVLRRLATVSLVLATGHWLFMEPMVRSAVDVKAGENISSLYESLVLAPRKWQTLRRLNSTV